MPRAEVARELAFAARVLREERDALERLAHGIGGGPGAARGAAFARALDLVCACADAGGTVLVTGLGKSGLIGAKISATMSSLGIPSHSVHPAEAAHGDLGRFRATDLVIAISHSGETEEVVNLALTLRQDGLRIIAVCAEKRGGASGADARSTLERLATVALLVPVDEEAGAPDYAAPTSSTTAALALGDALALSAAKRRRFTHEDFARRHPGGALGGLMRPVTDVLRFVAGKNLPLAVESASVSEALRVAAEGGRRPGALVVVRGRGKGAGTLAGIFTDADLRRLILRDPGELERPIGEVMTRSPRTLRDDALVRDAVRLVREFRSDEVPVVDGKGRPVGILDVQDLVAMRLIRE